MMTLEEVKNYYKDAKRDVLITRIHQLQNVVGELQSRTVDDYIRNMINNARPWPVEYFDK